MSEILGTHMVAEETDGGVMITGMLTDAGKKYFGRRQDGMGPINDPVNHPKHYTSANGIECIDAIDGCIEFYGDPQHAYLVGQVLKYLWRAPLKDDYSQDIHKAQFYLNRLVAKLDADQSV